VAWSRRWCRMRRRLRLPLRRRRMRPSRIDGCRVRVCRVG